MFSIYEAKHANPMLYTCCFNHSGIKKSYFRDTFNTYVHVISDTFRLLLE